MEVKTCFIIPKIEKIKMEDISFSKASVKKLCENDIISLAANIKKNGLLMPLFLRRNIENNKKYILVSGYRRYMALKFLEAEVVPSIVLSLTEPEAEIFNLCIDETYRSFSVFERAEVMGKLLKSGRITKMELAEALGISMKRLEKRLKVLEITSDQKKIIINMGFSKDFVYEFLNVNKDNKNKILNEIIIKDFSDGEAINYIKENINPKKEPLRSACLTDDKIIFNSIERMAEHLKESGISAHCRRVNLEDRTEYTLIIEKKLRQMVLPL